jgi:hypothetical protein
VLDGVSVFFCRRVQQYCFKLSLLLITAAAAADGEADVAPLAIADT